MPSIERTAYPCFSPITTANELQQSFTPTDAEREFAQASTRTNQHAFCFLVLLKCFQRLDYFPPLEEIPSAIVDHLRSCLQLFASVCIDDPERGGRIIQSHQLDLGIDREGVSDG